MKMTPMAPASWRRRALPANMQSPLNASAMRPCSSTAFSIVPHAVYGALITILPFTLEERDEGVYTDELCLKMLSLEQNGPIQSIDTLEWGICGIDINSYTGISNQ